MTKRDFFILIVKLFGLTSIITSLFSVLPAYMSYGLLDFDGATILWMSVTLIILVGLFVLLTFHAERIVRLLRLDKGFDNNRIDLGNLNAVEILQVGIIIIGGFLVLDNIAEFFSHAYMALKNDINGKIFGTTSTMNWAINAMNLLIGYLLLTNHYSIAKILNKGNKDTVG